MSIVVSGGLKGGSGKSTVATNLAILRSAEGKDVLLIDADDQETASDFTQLRTEQKGSAGYSCIRLGGPAVRSETLKLRHKYQDILIDTGGRDTSSQRAAMAIADLLLVPFVPRSFDIWTLEKVAQLVEEMRTANESLQVATFLNRADPRGQDNGDVADLLKEAERHALRFCGLQLGVRKAFGNAASQGLAVTELKPGDEKASAEMKALYRYVFDVALRISPPQTAVLAGKDAA